MDYRESYHTETTVDSDGKIVVSIPFPVGERVEVTVTPHEEVVEPASSEENIPTLAELMAPYVGIIKDMPEDLAENHDYYAHGAPKRKK
jgi:hypothetical protein